MHAFTYGVDMVNSSKACVVYGMRRVESSGGWERVSNSSTKIVGAAHLCEITMDELKTRVRVPASLLRSDGSVESDVMVIMPKAASKGSLSRVIRGALHVNWPASALFVLIHRWWCDEEFGVDSSCTWCSSAKRENISSFHTFMF